jgi:hypothetical protein
MERARLDMTEQTLLSRHAAGQLEFGRAVLEDLATNLDNSKEGFVVAEPASSIRYVPRWYFSWIWAFWLTHRLCPLWRAVEACSGIADGTDGWSGGTYVWLLAMNLAQLARPQDLTVCDIVHTP